MAWYRNEKAAVVEALRRGERPDLATTMASGPLDELEVQRERAGVADELLLRTLATLPFVEAASPPWRKLGLVPRTSRAVAPGLGPGANPSRQQWTTSPSRWTPSRVLALSSGYLARYPASGGGVGLAARASGRGQGALPATIGAWAGLCRRWQRAGRCLSSGGFGVCVGHPSGHRGLA